MSGPLPPFVQFTDFLPESDHRRLMDWVRANHAKFGPALVNKGSAASVNRVDPDKRIAAVTRDLGSLAPMLRERLLATLPAINAALGMRIEATSLELELAAHGDGAFFAPHTDIPVGAVRQPLSETAGQDRLLSAVYYFHQSPKVFSGGELRLYRFGAAPGDGDHVDLAPTDNSLVAFPTSAVHEVRPVRVPGNRFDDQRFALNCWYCRPL